MKTFVTLAICIVLASIATSSASASLGRDSVVFDGDESAYPIPPEEEHCTVKVLALEGIAKGLTMSRERTNTCGVVKYTDRWSVKKLVVGDDVAIDQVITTDPGTTLTLQTDAGAIITVDGDSEILLGDVCGKKPRPILVIKYGGAKINDRPAPPPHDPDGPPGEPPPPPGPDEIPPPPADDAPPITTHTQLVKVVPKGTVYSVRTGAKDANGETVVRCYIGSVEVIPGLQAVQAEMVDVAKDADQLTKDFQAGKITQQEYTKRITAIGMATAKKADGVVTSVVLKAGEKCAVNQRGEASKAKKFDVNKE